MILPYNNFGIIIWAFYNFKIFIPNKFVNIFKKKLLIYIKYIDIVKYFKIFELFRVIKYNRMIKQLENIEFYGTVIDLKIVKHTKYIY